MRERRRSGRLRSRCADGHGFGAARPDAPSRPCDAQATRDRPLLLAKVLRKIRPGVLKSVKTTRARLDAAQGLVLLAGSKRTLNDKSDAEGEGSPEPAGDAKRACGAAQGLCYWLTALSRRSRRTLLARARLPARRRTRRSGTSSTSVQSCVRCAGRSSSSRRPSFSNTSTNPNPTSGMAKSASPSA